MRLREILGVYQDRFFWRWISEFAYSNQVVRDNPFILIWIGTLFYRRAIVAVRTMVDAGQQGRKSDRLTGYRSERHNRPPARLGGRRP
jgi:hypothetical protein